MIEVAIKCKTPGCGGKILATAAEGTTIATGYVRLQCPRCKQSAFMRPEPAATQVQPKAA